MNNIEIEKNFVSELIDIVETARDMSYRAANLMQVASNWLVGWRIVEQEQHGEKRAAYGKHIIEIASKAMTEKFGQGFSETTLRAYRKFTLSFLFCRFSDHCSLNSSWQIKTPVDSPFCLNCRGCTMSDLCELHNRYYPLFGNQCWCRTIFFTRHQQADVCCQISDIHAFKRRTAQRDRKTEGNLPFTNGRRTGGLIGQNYYRQALWVTKYKISHQW